MLQNLWFAQINHDESLFVWLKKKDSYFEKK